MNGITIQPSGKSLSEYLPPGAFRTDDHRYYFNGQGPLPGVTSVLDIISKPDLLKWKVSEAARQAVLNWPVTARKIAEEGTDEAIKWVLSLVDDRRDKAAILGSAVHLLADDYARMPAGGQEKPSESQNLSLEVIPYLEAYKGFLARYSASNIVSSEKMVWSANGYGGTYDLLMLIDGELWLIDIKTSKGYYPEFGLQLAAYRWADAIILEGDPRPYPMPTVIKTGVLHLRPDKYPKLGWSLIEYPTIYESDYMAFLGALELHKWRLEGRFSRQNLKQMTVAVTEATEGH